MEKIKLCKMYFEAMEEMKKHFSLYNESFYTIMERFIKNDFEGCEYLEELKHFDLEDIAKLLIIGYELEETPEEEIARVYNLCLDWNSNDFNKYFAKGMKFVIDKLNLNIKGIRD